TAQPRYPSQRGVEYSEEVTNKVRAGILRADPEALGVEVRITGTYPFNSATNAVINSDMLRTTIVSSIGVFVIFLIAFGSVFYSIIAVVPLLISVVLTMCWAKFAVGGFNLVTTFLPALVLGLGIDYAIHIIARYAEERAKGGSLNRSLYASVLHKGEASFYAAATTSLVFVGLLLAKSRALFEMGVISSVGVMIAFVVTLFLLPSMITLAHFIFRNRMRQRERVVGYAARLTGVVRWVTGKGRAIFVITLVLTFFITFQAARTSFVFSSTDLIPRVESQEVMDEILNRFAVSPAGIGSFFTFYAQTGQELREIVSRLSQHELVEVVLSAVDSVPIDLTEQQRVLNSLDIRGYIGQLDSLEQSIKERTAALAEIRSLLAQYSLLEYAASLSGQVEIALQSTEILEQLRRIQDRLTALDLHYATESVDALRSALLGLDVNLEEVRELPPADDLLRDILFSYPEALRSRYLTPDGQFVVQARVSRTIYNAGELDAFDRFAASFSDNYFGMPLVVKQLEHYMKRDFYLSTLLAAGLIAILLWVSLRGWIRALIAGAPLVLGYIWMLGGMRLLSMDFNFLSITISPLLIGIGVDNGIHILHRTIEERAKGLDGATERAVGATAVAVIVTSLTTMLVFGSLLVARTPGLRMLGASALLGIGFALLFCLLFLPAALHVEGGKRV
ncbi:MMPL family transporter, partial [Candidatus Bipolaricaulota bacterium]|nr:MMPL family transporter [Candidatus Bipolaricaulota bacterium]